jgi:hypothetical protein
MAAFDYNCQNKIMDTYQIVARLPGSPGSTFLNFIPKPKGFIPGIN